MKAKYKPIAMKCNQEQFDSIKDMIPLPIVWITSFEEDPYLLINEKKEVTNCALFFVTKNDITVIEIFDGKYFLECCGVEVLEDVSEQVWKGSEIQWRCVDEKKWNNSGRGIEYRLKPKPNLDADIEALQAKAKELGIKLTILIE